MSDIKPALERVERDRDSYHAVPTSVLALAACVRDLAEASMRHKHARRLTTEEAIKVQQGEDVPIFIDKECPLCAVLAKYGLPEGSEGSQPKGARMSARRNSERRCSTLVENPAGFIAAVLAKYGLSEGSEG